jgi:uncharacterized protein DUF3631
MLLCDVRMTFKAHCTDRLMTDQLLKALNDLEESPWASIKRDGKSLDARGLAQRPVRHQITKHPRRQRQSPQRLHA